KTSNTTPHAYQAYFRRQIPHLLLTSFQHCSSEAYIILAASSVVISHQSPMPGIAVIARLSVVALFTGISFALPTPSNMSRATDSAQAIFSTPKCYHIFHHDSAPYSPDCLQAINKIIHSDVCIMMYAETANISTVGSCTIQTFSSIGRAACLTSEAGKIRYAAKQILEHCVVPEEQAYALKSKRDGAWKGKGEMVVKFGVAEGQDAESIVEGVRVMATSGSQ
ncbi:hypothetical protein BDZ91DRAFT_833441, partial [Kalaharituber pfeilii]